MCFIEHLHFATFRMTCTLEYHTEVYYPTVFEHYTEYVNVDGQVSQLALLDTLGNQHDDQKRALSYADTDVALICFYIYSFI